MPRKMRYPFIRANGYYMSSNREFISEEVKRAAKIGAPQDTYCINYEGEPSTVEQLAKTNKEYAERLRGWVEKHGGNQL